MSRSDTMTGTHPHGRLISAVLLFICAAGLAYLAGDALKHGHDLVLSAGLALAGAPLAATGLALVVPGLPGRIGKAVLHRRSYLPPIEPTPLPDDLHEAAEQIADTTLALDGVALASLSAAAFTLSDEETNQIAVCAMKARQALEDAGRWSPALSDMYGALLNACPPAADAFLATLASDLIIWSEWDTLTAFYRAHDMRPMLPVPVETRFNAAGGRR